MAPLGGPNSAGEDLQRRSSTPFSSEWSTSESLSMIWQADRTYSAATYGQSFSANHGELVEVVGRVSIAEDN